MTGASPAVHGGWPARRAILRWAWRLARRESRSQLLLAALLATTAAVAATGLTAADQIAPAAAVAEFGDATITFDFEQTDRDALEVDAAAAARRLGNVDVIARRYVAVAGLFERLELRRQDPSGGLTDPLLDVVAGRAPRRAGDIALTDDLAELFDAPPGTTLTLPGGHGWEVVGLVENPASLGDSFALVTELPGGPEAATLYTDGDPAAVESLTLPSGGAYSVGRRGTGVGPFAAGLVLVASTLILLLVSLVAVAGFSVLARRRLRQLGMLAATGATRRQLELVMTGHGFLLGVIASMVGVSVGLVAWIALADHLEPLLSHRIDQYAVPWPFVAVAWALTIVATTAAARWPANEVVRVPVTRALSGRPDQGRPQTAADLRRGALLLLAGIACLVPADRPLESVVALVLTVMGLCLLVAGTVALAAPVIGLAARSGRYFPVGVRLAVRDLARHRRRSAAALAALSVVLALAVGTVLASTAAIHGAGEGNLSQRQLLLRVGEIPGRGDVAPIPERTAEELATMERAVQNIASRLDASAIVPVPVAVIPDLELGSATEGLVAAVVAVDVGGGFHRILEQVYVATDPLLAKYGLELHDLDPGARFLTTQQAEELFLEPIRPEVISPGRLEATYTSLPGTFITPPELQRRGWQAAPAGWLVEAAQPVTAQQVEEAVDTARGANLTVEARSGHANLAALRNGATAVAAAACLAILAATIGLVRGESARDRSILAAIGSTRRQQGWLATATAGTLAILAVGLGTSVAVLAALTQAGGPLASFWPPPLLHLALLCVGTPCVVGALTWLIATRTP